MYLPAEKDAPARSAASASCRIPKRKEAVLSETAPADLFVSPPFILDPAWIDYNGHLNMAYYHVLFDRTIDLAFEEIGIGPSYVARENLSFFTVEAHVCYVDEVRLDEHVEVRLRILDFDTKRLHVFEEMFKSETGTLAATCEQLFLHLDLTDRRVVPWSAEVAARIGAAHARDRAHPVPDRVGRRVVLSGKG